MDLLVVHRQVPDVVEELVVAGGGKGLDEDQVRYVGNESDDHALEQALLLKERHGGTVDVLAVGGDEAREALAMAKAKGADAVVHVAGEPRGHGDNRRLAARLADTVKSRAFDLLLTGTQAVEDLDGSLGGILAAHLGLPYVGYLAGVDLDPKRRIASVKKEYPGGVLALAEVAMPAVLGILAAERPPRYVPVSRVLQAKKSLAATEVTLPPSDTVGVSVVEFAKPDPVSRATMIAGDPEEVAESLVRILKERGLL